MIVNSNPESGHKAAVRFSFTGIIFTVIGPSLFWLAYPLGPFWAAGIAEFTVHIVRFIVFRSIVFPASKGYRVSPSRYIISALPISLAGFLSIAVFRNKLDRTSLTLITTLISVVVGFLWSRYVYSKPSRQPSSGFAALLTPQALQKDQVDLEK